MVTTLNDVKASDDVHCTLFGQIECHVIREKY